MDKQQKFQPKSFFRKYWYVSLFVFAFVLLVIAQVLRLLTPPPPLQTNSWNGITPGRSTLSQLDQQFGLPIQTQQSQLGTVLSYQSEFPTLPHQVVVDQENTVQFIKEYIPYSPDLKIDQYIQQFGQPDLELIEPEAGEAARAYVFLSQGLVIVAHVTDGTIEQRWYFTPTTESAFLQSWGQELTDQEAGPEPFQFPLGAEDLE